MMRYKDLLEMKLVLGKGMRTIDMDDDKTVIKLGSKRTSSVDRFISQFNSITDEHPFSRGMRYFRDGPVLVNLHAGMDEDTVILQDIQSKSRGAGAKAMKVICQMADDNEVIIELLAKGYAHVPTEKLVSYYERFGFEPQNDFHEDGVTMFRHPD